MFVFKLNTSLYCYNKSPMNEINKEHKINIEIGNNLYAFERPNLQEKNKLFQTQANFQFHFHTTFILYPVCQSRARRILIFNRLCNLTKFDEFHFPLNICEYLSLNHNFLFKQHDMLKFLALIALIWHTSYNLKVEWMCYSQYWRLTRVWKQVYLFDLHIDNFLIWEIIFSDLFQKDYLYDRR